MGRAGLKKHNNSVTIAVEKETAELPVLNLSSLRSAFISKERLLKSEAFSMHTESTHALRRAVLHTTISHKTYTGGLQLSNAALQIS